MFIVVGLLILSLIITVHELGHFLAAKSFGIGVVEFSLGMGPVLLHRRFGETVYSVRLLPIGGFCAMYGEESVEAAGKGDVSGDAALTAKQKKMGYKTDWDAGRSLISKPKWQQMGVMLAGPGFNILLAWLAAFLLTFTPNAYLGQPVIIGLSETVSVAADAGIRPGDVIIAVEDRRVMCSQDFSAYLDTHPKLYETGFTAVFLRPDADGAGTPDAYQVTLVPDPETMLIGVSYRGLKAGDNLKEHLSMSTGVVRHWFLVCVDSLGMLFRGDANISDMSGVIGVTSFVGTTVEQSAAQSAATAPGDSLKAAASVFGSIMNLIAFISVNLGVMNMIPLPALDGGRALICLIEGVVKKQVPERAQSVINAVGMAAILLLFGITTVADIARLVTAG